MADEAPSEVNTFLSWSLPRSQAVATALRKWLPGVIQRCKPWMSDQDIDTGQRWRTEIAGNLNNAQIGVVCITQENRERTWLNFEAGALSRQVKDVAKVCCYFFGMKPTDIDDKHPLADFNGAETTAEGTWRLVKSINNALAGQKVGEVTLETVFKAMWPTLEKDLKAIPAPPADSPSPTRNPNDMLEEILLRVRQLENQVGDLGLSVNGDLTVTVPTVKAMDREAMQTTAREMAQVATLLMLHKPPRDLSQEEVFLILKHHENLPGALRQQAEKTLHASGKFESRDSPT